MVNEKEIISKILNNQPLTEQERKYCVWECIGEYVDTIEKGSGRWMCYITTVFKIGEQYYAIDWERGLTEIQDNMYLNDPYPVERHEEIVTKTVITYKRKEKETVWKLLLN